MEQKTDTPTSKTPVKTKDGIVNLELGSIIRVISPTNPEYNNKIYLITYIDDETLELLGDDFTTPTLNIVDGLIRDESITTIELLSDPDVKGYARQNGLLPRTWVNIHFGGDLPVTFTGVITTIEEDMIEITTYPDDNVIYIDFGYKGIPKNIPIERIVIREPPISRTTAVVGSEEEVGAVEERKLADVEEGVEKSARAEDERTGEEKDEEKDEDADDESIIPAAELDEFEVLDIVDSDEVLRIVYEQDVPESERRYPIDIQTRDLYDDIVSNIPKNKQTNAILNKVSSLIDRFKTLRTQLSTLNESGVIDGFVTKGADYKPLVNSLLKFDKDVKWLLPVVQNRKKLYTTEIPDEEDRVTDAVFNMSNNAVEDEITEIQRYMNNQVGGVEKPYTSLYSSINERTTPFLNPTTDTNTIIYKQKVDTNIHTVVDNFDEDDENFYSSVVKTTKLGDDIETRRFVIEKYNLGLKRVKTNYKSGSVDNTTEEQIGSNDKVNVKSLIFLPERNAMHYRGKQLNSSIYTKSEENTVNIPFWNSLRRMTSIVDVDVDTSDASKKETEYDDRFLKDILNIRMNTMSETTDASTMKENYTRFLELAVPRTKTLFQLVKKYITNRVNFSKIIRHIEPFLVYHSELSFKQYESIVEYMIEHINKLVAQISRNSESYNNLRRLPIGISYGGPKLFNELQSAAYRGEELQSKDEAAYGVSKKTLPGNVMKNILTADYGELYNTTVALETSNLVLKQDVVGQLEEKLEEYKREKDSAEEKKNRKKKCDTRQIVKVYNSVLELETDNKRPDVFYDQKYDKTRYDIVNEYKEQREAMNVEDFKSFLVEQLKRNIGLDDVSAEYDAEAMIEGKRRVRDGDYAYYIERDTEYDINNYYYYKREGDSWVQDTGIGTNTTEEQFNSLCNLLEPCLKVKEGCDNVEQVSINMVTDLSEKIVKELVEDYKTSADEKTTSLNSKQTNKRYRIQQLRRLIYELLTQYSKNKTQLGETAELNEDIVRSPYITLRDAILGQRDALQRKMNILRFINNFTRPAKSSVFEKDEFDDTHGEEDPYWLYCTLTNTKLLPSFYETLAKTSMYNYDEVTDAICRERGEISDDGSKWVDKYSGYVIKDIEFDVDEGYDEKGFKISTHAVLEKDIESKIENDDNDAIEEAAEDVVEEPVKLTDRQRSIYNVINSILFTLGVSLNDAIKIKMIHTVDNLVIDYSEALKKSDKYQRYAKDKQVKELNKYMNKTLLLSTGLLILFTIQTAYPRPRINTVSNCTRSISGFPMKGKEDMSGLTYIICILLRTASNSSIWSALIRDKKNYRKDQASVLDKLQKTMVNFYDEYLVKSPFVVERIREYEALRSGVAESGEAFGDEGIPKELDVKNTWQQFLPPLNKVVLHKIGELAPEYMNDLLRHVKSGNKKQFAEQRLLESKIFLNSLSIMNHINRVVAKKDFEIKSLSGIPYLENACCLEDTDNAVLSYFIKRERDIKELSKQVFELTKVYTRVKGLTKANTLYSELDTKLKYPKIVDVISQRTIYSAFIKYCLFNKGIQLIPALQDICLTNTSGFSDINTIDEKIAVMVAEGKEYSEEAFLKLMRVVNKNNKINISLEFEDLSRETKFIRLMKDDVAEEEAEAVAEEAGLDADETLVDSVVTPELKELIVSLLTYDGTNKDEVTERQDKIEDYILPRVDETTANLITFIERNSKRSRARKDNAIRFIQDFDKLRAMKTTVLMSSEDNTTMKYANYIRNIVQELLVVFPSMIQNKVNYTDVNVSKHWGLSQRHTYDVQNIIGSYYRNLNAFYKSASIEELVPSVLDNSKKLLDIANTIPFQAGHTTSGFAKINADMMSLIYKYLFIESMNLYMVLAVDDTTQERVAEVLIEFINIFINERKAIDYNIERVNERILGIKEREKNSIIERLTALSEEQHRINSRFREHGLGVWGTGLQKSYREYVKERYDAEVEELEENYDMLNLAMIEEELAEINDLSGIGDDDEDVNDIDRNEYYTHLNE